MNVFAQSLSPSGSKAFQRTVERCYRIRYYLRSDRRDGSRKQPEIGVYLDAARHNVHAEPLRDDPHSDVQRKKLHEHLRDTAVASMDRGTLEQCVADAAVAMLGEHRQPELRALTIERYMRHANESEAVVLNAKDRVALEVDPLDVIGNDSRSKSGAEPQASILRWQREKVRHQRRTQVRA